MLKKILLALDGSENAEKALPWVKRFAQPSVAQVVLFRAVPEEGYPAAALPSRLKEARDYLFRFARDLNYAGIPCKIAVKPGKVAPSIVKAAMDEECDLILLTTRGGSKVTRWLVGGVTEQVMRLSPFPVLVVRSQMRLGHQARVRRIVVPVDGSRLAESALPWAQQLAASFRAQLELVHVYPAFPLGIRAKHGEAYAALRKRMEFKIRQIRRSGLRASFRVLRGDAAERLIRFAGPKDLIVTTTHGAGGFKRWIFGSVAEKVIHASPVPVLVFKAPGQARRFRWIA